jgi:hypothetical protein
MIGILQTLTPTLSMSAPKGKADSLIGVPMSAHGLNADLRGVTTVI